MFVDKNKFSFFQISNEYNPLGQTFQKHFQAVVELTIFKNILYRAVIFSGEYKVHVQPEHLLFSVQY